MSGTDDWSPERIARWHQGHTDAVNNFSGYTSEKIGHAVRGTTRNRLWNTLYNHFATNSLKTFRTTVHTAIDSLKKVIGE